MATVFGVDLREAAKSTGTRVPGRQDRMLSPDYRRQAIATALANVSRQQAMDLQPDPTLGAPFSSFPDNRLTVAQMGPGEPAENFPLAGEPRQWVYRVGRNFPTTPDTDRGISGQLLRMLADASWLVRRCIEIRKHELCSLDWDIVPRGQNAQERRANAVKHAALIKYLREFWRNPEAYFSFDVADPDYSTYLDENGTQGRVEKGDWVRKGLLGWQDWLNACLEDYFVGDWLALWPQRTLGNEMLGLRRVDGSTIKALIDLDGRIPPPPMPAWQQYLYGVPRASWSSDEFYFLPRDVRNTTTFGFSLVQQSLVMVNLALKFDQWNTAAYTESTIPMGLLETPEGFTADQIRDVADFLNGAIADLGARQRVYPVPNGTKWQAIKPFDFNSEFAYFLVEGVAGCFDVQAQEIGIVRQTGGLGSKGHADQQEAIRRRKSFIPLARWVESWMTRVINEQWRREGGGDLEFRFPDLVHDEQQSKVEALKVAIMTGQKSIDEVCEEQGEPGPGYGRIMETSQGLLFLDKGYALTANGMVPLRLPEPGEASVFGPHQPPQEGERQEHPGAATQAGDAVPKATKAADDSHAEERRKKVEEAFMAAWLLWWRDKLKAAGETAPTRVEMAHRALEITRADQLVLAKLLQVTLRGPAYADAWVTLQQQAGIPGHPSQPTGSDSYRLEYGSQAHMAEVAATYLTDLDAAFQKAISETQLEADEMVRAEKVLAMMIEWAHSRAKWKGEQIVATELTDAQSQASRDFATQNPKLMNMFRWRAVMDDKTCDVCRGLDGQIVSATGPHPPAHPNCLPADARVLAEGVSAATKRWFDGNLVVIRTASGKNLSCTPNHPILTPHGWVAASRLNEGDSVISSGVRDWVPSVGHDHQDVPPCIEQVADALRGALGVSAREVPTAAEDFHGDGVGSVVAVVWSDGLLDHQRLAALDDQSLDEAFPVRTPLGEGLDGERVLDLLVEPLAPPARRCVRCGREFLPLGLRGFSHADVHGVTSVPDRNAGGEQDAPDRLATDAVGLREGLLGLARSVATDDLGVGEPMAPARALRRPAAADDLHARASQATLDGRSEDAELASQILHGATGPVFADEVVDVQIQAFHGYVFNLQTATGHYVAEGIVTHNCRCHLEPVTPNRGAP